MRLSDVRRRKPEPLYLNHSTPPALTEAETRCSNRLLGAFAICRNNALKNGFRMN
jgi:hypothetical protein